MAQTPLLILGDGPDSHTGLARIGHDLAWLLSSMPEFRVGYLGRESFGRCRFPWTQYSFSARDQWGERRLEEAWNDLAQGQEGIILTVWDASRLLWLAHPTEMPKSLQALLRSPRAHRWGYFMVDSCGVQPDRLPLEQKSVMEAYDRVLIASKWGWQLAKNSLPSHQDLDWLPHPINRQTFAPQDRMTARSFWNVDKGTPLIGCVMANQERKHWSTVFEAISMMPGAVLWAHPDTHMGYWNIGALAVEYGLQDRVILENRPLTDGELAVRYSACDVTAVISGAEGFCYPAAESLSCGIPCVAGAYGAQRDLCFHEMLVDPEYTRVETNHNVRRAYYDPRKVAAALDYAVKLQRSGNIDATKQVEHLDFPNLGILWRRWFEKGLVMA